MTHTPYLLTLRMRFLFIDLASGAQSFALVDEEKTIGWTLVADQKRDDVLMGQLNGLLKECGRTWADLTHIACATGPGGFMSLRVGVSLANALGYALKIPVAGVHLSDVWAARVRHEIRDKRLEIRDKRQGKKAGLSSQVSHLTSFFWLHSTRREELFVRGYGTFAMQWPQPVLMTLADFRAQAADEGSYIGELIPHQQEILTGWKPYTDIRPVADVLPGFLSDLSYGKDLLLPWYGREG